MNSDETLEATELDVEVATEALVITDELVTTELLVFTDELVLVAVEVTELEVLVFTLLDTEDTVQACTP